MSSISAQGVVERASAELTKRINGLGLRTSKHHGRWWTFSYSAPSFLFPSFGFCCHRLCTLASSTASPLLYVTHHFLPLVERRASYRFRVEFASALTFFFFFRAIESGDEKKDLRAFRSVSSLYLPLGRR